MSKWLNREQVEEDWRYIGLCLNSKIIPSCLLTLEGDLIMHRLIQKVKQLEEKIMNLDNKVNSMTLMNIKAK